MLVHASLSLWFISVAKQALCVCLQVTADVVSLSLAGNSAALLGGRVFRVALAKGAQGTCFVGCLALIRWKKMRVCRNASLVSLRFSQCAIYWLMQEPNTCHARCKDRVWRDACSARGGCEGEGRGKRVHLLAKWHELRFDLPYEP